MSDIFTGKLVKAFMCRKCVKTGALKTGSSIDVWATTGFADITSGSVTATASDGLSMVQYESKNRDMKMVNVKTKPGAFGKSYQFNATCSAQYRHFMHLKDLRYV